MQNKDARLEYQNKKVIWKSSENCFKKYEMFSEMWALKKLDEILKNLAFFVVFPRNCKIILQNFDNIFETFWNNFVEVNEGISNSISDFDYFKIPDASTPSKFCKFHPQQFQTGEFCNWNKTFLNKNKNLKWLTYSNEKKVLYCFVCMAYGNADGRNAKNVFIRGFTDFKNHYDRIKEHEISHEHSTNAEAFFRWK